MIFNPKVIQDQARDQLLGDPFFSNNPVSAQAIPVISADPGDIDTEINAALERLGLGVLILVPQMKVNHPNLPGPYFDGIRMTAEIIEATTLNRGAAAYVTATTTAMVVAALLHEFAPDGINERLYVRQALPVPDPTKTYNMWHIELSGKAGVAYAIPPIAPVVADSLVAGPVNLSCATPGAAMFYTLDKTYPGPRNPSAQLALGPINVAAGQTLSARAWLAGYAPPAVPVLTLQY